MAINGKHTGLLLIDIQKGFQDASWGPRHNHHAEANAARLLHHARSINLPVIHVQHASSDIHSPLNPRNEGYGFCPEVEPLGHEKVVKKSVNSAFIGTDLTIHLKQSEITSLIVAGITTNHCVSTSVRMASNLGFSVYLVEDACTAFERTGPDGSYYSAEEIHAVSIANLHEEFAEILRTDVMCDLLRTSKQETEKSCVSSPSS